MSQKIVKYSLLFTLFLSFQKIRAQYFGHLINNPAQYYSTVLSEPKDGKYKVLNLRYPGTDGVFKCPQVLRFDQNLQFSDSVNLLKGIYNVLNEPLKMSNKFFWPVIIADTLTNNANLQKLIVLEMDTLYHILNTYSISNYENTQLFPSNLCYFNNYYYVSKSNGFYHSGANIIYKLNPQFVKVDSIIFTNSWVRHIYSFNNNLMIGGDWLPAPCGGPGYPDKLTIDVNFNTIDCYSLSNFSITESCFSILPISKTKCFVSGTNWVGNTPTDYELVNTIFDHTNQVKSSLSFNYPQKNSAYIDHINFSAIQKNEIITTGIHDYNFLGLYENHSSFIFVNKIDTSGNLLWKKSYGGDLFYRPHSIAFTGDGGCLISGLRYDYVNPLIAGIMESFLLKLDASGNINSVGIFENGELKSNTLRCFPNPASNYLKFDLPFQENISIVLIDKQGKEIKTIQTYQNLSQIDISDIAPGVYTYSVNTKNSSFSGKWVKGEN